MFPDVMGKAGKLGSNGGGWPPGPAKAPGVRWGPKILDKEANPAGLAPAAAAAAASAIGLEELIVSFTDPLCGLDDTTEVGTLLALLFDSDLMEIGLLSAFLEDDPCSLISSFLAASCLMYSS